MKSKAEIWLINVKDNFLFFTLVPVLFGGAWQFINLLSMGVPYLRFFSVTQQISDGIIFVFLLSIIISAVFLFIRISRYVDTIMMKLKLNNTSQFVLAITIILIYVIDFKFSSELFVIIKNHYFSDFSLFLFIILRVFIYGLMFKLLVSLEVLDSKKSMNNSTGIALFLAVFCLYNLAYFVESTPVNLKNKDLLIEKFEKKYKLKKKTTIVLYFNDKYVFLRNSNDITVLKIDALFDI